MTNANLHDQLIFTASSPGLSGTVAAITSFLAERGCYITEMQQFDDVISDRFYVRIVVRTDRDKTPAMAVLDEEFAPIAESIQLEYSFHDASTRPRVMILVSKFDHCLNDLLYRWRTNDLEMDITAIVSNHPDLKRLADWHEIPFVHLPVTPASKKDSEQRLLELVDNTQTDLVVLARYMQVLSQEMCEKLSGKVINIHHSFLPGFKGAKPYHQAFDRGVKLIGATAHYVTSDLDEGPIIEQVVERVDHSYRPEHLVTAGRDCENLALARAIKLHINHRVFIEGNKTVVFR